VTGRIRGALGRPALGRLAVVVLASALALTSVTVADANSTQTKTQRDEIRRQQAAAAAALDPLKAEDAQLEQAYRATQSNVRAQEATIASTAQAIAQAEATQRDLEARIAAARASADDLRRRLRDSAVAAYMDPHGDAGDLLHAPSFNAIETKKALLSVVTDRNLDASSALRAVEADLRVLEDEQQATIAELTNRRADQQRQLDELRVARDQALSLSRALDARIAAFQREVDSLASEDASLTALLTRQLAQEEAARKAAAEAQARLALGDRTPPANTPPSARGLVWPSSGSVTSRFGPRWGRLHAGIDIANAVGTPVVAANTGRVVHAGWYGGYGNAVIIDHGGGFSTVYAHLSSIGTSLGAAVTRGQSIGQMGNTGNSTGPHLHFETRIGGVAYDPARYLP
jgi:murein DD-endopeptidase MepM/ murein hydrolase activator NlpD